MIPLYGYHMADFKELLVHHGLFISVPQHERHFLFYTYLVLYGYDVTLDHDSIHDLEILTIFMIRIDFEECI